MLQRVGRRKDVLDVGCATGYFAKLMSSHDCSVTGIDINVDSVEAAKKYCSRVFVADLDFTGLAEAVQGNSFDVIVFGDVLEHLRYPVRILDEARTLLRADGYVVASIPNIAHGAIRLALLRGDFDYQEFGILDETHLRFFTLKTVEELFLEAGYEIKQIDRTKLELFESSELTELVPNISRDEFSEETIAQVQRDPEFDTLQFVVQAFPMTDEAKLRTITKRFIGLNTELSNSKSAIARQSLQLAAARTEISSREPAAQAELAHLTALASDLQQRVVASDTARTEAVTERDRLSGQLGDLRSELQQRAAEREALAADRDMWRGKASSELPAAQAEIARLTALASDLQQRAIASDAARTEAVAERDRLLSSLQDVSAQLRDLRSELQQRATEREALAADRDMWRGKVSSELPAAQAEIARLTALESELQQRAIASDAARAEAVAELAGETAAADAFEAELERLSAIEEASRNLASEHASLVRENATLWEELAAMDALQSELESLKEELDAVKAQRESSSVLARQQSLVTQRLQQSLAQGNGRLGALEGELARLSDAMRGAHEEMLKAQDAFETRNTEAQRAVTRMEDLESQNAELSRAMRDAHREMLKAQGEGQQLRQALESNEELTSEIAVLRSENSAAGARAAEMSQSLEKLRAEYRALQEWATSQSMLTLADIQQDTRELVNLIDAVQSSRFWGIKRVLNRILAALRA